MNNNYITIYGFNDSIAYCEVIGLSNCFKAYASNASRASIESIGFNPSSGYVYIALENGIQICSMLGRDVEFLVTDFDSGVEYFYENYEEAENYKLI